MNHGRIEYVELPSTDVGRSAAFYEGVFGWSSDVATGSFELPGTIGRWATDRPPSPSAGPLLWISTDQLGVALQRVEAHGGVVRVAPWCDHGERWLAEIDDPEGNRLGVVAPARTARPQTLLVVRDVEASSRWYQALLGLRSAHGGPDYERLTADGELVLQLHRWETEHDHGRIGDPAQPVGNGVLVWFGEVTDFDGTVRRAEGLGARIIRPVRRNPPAGGGNGPAHRELWLEDLDGYTIVVASPDGEAFER